MTHKGENYSLKLQNYYFCNGTIKSIREYFNFLFFSFFGVFMRGSTCDLFYTGDMFAPFYIR